MTRLPVLYKAGPIDPLVGWLAFIAILSLQGDDAGLVLGSQTERLCSGRRQKLPFTAGAGVSGRGADLWCQSRCLWRQEYEVILTGHFLQ